MLNIFTLALDAMPWITHHLPVLNRLKCDWRWVIVEGVAANTHCTYWCQPMAPRASLDGTSQYLDTITAQHPRVTVLRNLLWDGKVSMCNAALERLTEPGVLLQMDADELWSDTQLEKLVKVFTEYTAIHWANFYCNYFIGPNIVTTDNTGDWILAWRYKPGMRFMSHEPPNLDGNKGNQMKREETRDQGLVFDHMSYVTEAQLRFKEGYYGPRFRGATEQWKKFQANTQWPVRVLRAHLNFAGEQASADLFIK